MKYISKRINGLLKRVCEMNGDGKIIKMHREREN